MKKKPAKRYRTVTGMARDIIGGKFASDLKKKIEQKPAKSKTAKAKAPLDCTFEELCRIRCDNKDSGGFWTLADGSHVTFGYQPRGQNGEMVTMPIPVFKRLLKFLTTPQKLKEVHHAKSKS